MAAIDDLKTAWVAKIALISDTLIKAKATYLIDNYIAALPKQAALEAQTIDSYSIAGRSFTYREAAAGKAMVNAMEAELYRLCYGSVSLADANTGVDIP